MSKNKHIHTDLDEFGYCVECDKRIITRFAGYQLPDRPAPNVINLYSHPKFLAAHLGSEVEETGPPDFYE